MQLSSNPVVLAKKLISIYSVSGEEAAIARYIFKYLRAIGLRPKFNSLGSKRANLYVLGNGPVLINGHMDTVPIGDRGKWSHNPFGDHDRAHLYGRGSSDTKGSIACVLAALTRQLSPMVSCSFTVNEEDTFAGIKSLMRLRNTIFKHIRYCVNLEPTDLRIVVAHKGQMTFQVVTRGVSAHASVPEKGENAILIMTKIISKIEQYAERLQKRKHRLLGYPTINIGVIRGGTMSNVVPNWAECFIDRRIIPGEKIAAITDEFKRVVQPAEMRVSRTFSPVELAPKTMVVKTMQRILQSYKRNALPTTAPFTTEFSELIQHGIKGFIFGAGSVDQAHTIGESVPLKSLEVGFCILRDFIIAMGKGKDEN